MVYRLLADWKPDRAALEAALEAARFVPCGAQQDKSVGWVEPRGQAHGALVEVVGGQWLLKLCLEQKAVPASVVKRKVEQQVAEIETRSGRKPGKKERRELAEDARQTLLPLAFSKLSSVLVWVDPAAGLLLTDAGSTAKADEVMSRLIQAIDGLGVQLINTHSAPATAMAHWLASKEAPPGFSIDRECELKAADESKAVVRYSRHALDTEEVSQHIAMGKLPTRLALTWDDRVSFVLTESLQLKKLTFLDTALESAASVPGDNGADDFDADATLSTGELSRLLPALLQALGGEMPLIAAAAA